MRARLVAPLVAGLVVLACADVQPSPPYLIVTNFYTLQRGITKQQFLDTWQRATDAKHIVGGRPASSQAFRVGDDFWEVWLYNLYANDGRVASTTVDHQEYVA